MLLIHLFFLRLAEILLQENESEKESINSTIEEFRGIIKEQEEELVSARQTINDLTTQLSQSHHAREEGALRAAR